MERIIGALLTLGLLGACGAPPPGPSAFAPQSIVSRAAGEPGATDPNACWAQDAGSGRWIETPCARDLPPDFVATLQRALAARGLFEGPVTGTVDAATRDGVRRYQTPRGLNSAVLSLGAAEQMGLVPVAAARAQAAEASLPDTAIADSIGPKIY